MGISDYSIHSVLCEKTQKKISWSSKIAEGYGCSSVGLSLQKNHCGMSCSFHLAITGELTAVQRWCTRIAASIRTVSAKCSLYHRNKQQISSNSWAAIWLVLSFQSRKTNMINQDHRSG